MEFVFINTLQLAALLMTLMIFIDSFQIQITLNHDCYKNQAI